MGLRLKTFLLTGVFLFSARANAGEPVTIGVMDFDGLSGVSQEKADVIADIIAQEIGNLGNVQVITKSDIKSMLNLEKQKRLSGCTDTECFSEVAGALGMPWLVTGNLSRMGDSYILNLKLMNVRKVIVVKRITHRTRGNEDDLLDELPEATEKLFEVVTEQWGLTVEKRVTVAARHSQPISQTPSAATVITKKQIKNTHCTDIVCLLRQVAEVDVRRITPSFPVVGARAMTEDFGNKALVLVDERELNIELFGHTQWTALPIHLEDIERIEIIRGPGSALYGANAHSMVVSIITRETEESKAEVFLGNGELDRSSLHLRLSQPLGNWRAYISGGFESEGHWRIQNRRERESVHTVLRFTHEADTSKSVVQLGVVHPEGVVYTQLAPAKGRDTYLYHLFLSHRTDLLRTHLTWRVIDQTWDADMPLDWQATKLGDFPRGVNFFSSNVDADVQINLSPFDGNLMIAGGNYRWFYIASDDIDPEKTHQHRIGFFIHDEQSLSETLVLTAGVRLDYNTITPLAISPRLAGVWQFSDNQFLRLAFGQAFRKPSFYETSMHFTGVKGTEAFPNLGEFFHENIGNDKLGNEKTTTLEASYRAQFLDNSLTLETDVFFALFRNTISFQLDIKTDAFGLPDLNKSEMRFENTGREVDSVGGSVSLTYRIQTWRFAANYTFRHSWYISDPPGGPAPAEGSKGERVPWEPAHLVNLSFNYIPQRGLRLGMALHGHSSCDLAWPEDGSLFGRNILVHSPPAYFISGYLAWRFDSGSWWTEIGVRAFNIFNAGFRDLPAMIRPDGVELGGELLGRRIILFMRASI